ncbi:hypothetical protein AGDE_14223 [Angomonas deanei]|uniref:Uncharacterized protein n=1 Tax=Angomonas deanei TaxID=59799 RepID=A0A7G2CPJ0_9TRYP|nr:hypothetical protein AGDE_14223 [Angomonas deanei]CAD2221017.1 hypothetical protein, conserved [Angomonas deanei]|eukprot:EPY21233.1 hypothetical protein AGDE_14223 [Angomonas deanei]
MQFQGGSHTTPTTTSSYATLRVDHMPSDHCRVWGQGDVANKSQQTERGTMTGNLTQVVAGVHYVCDNGVEAGPYAGVRQKTGHHSGSNVTISKSQPVVGVSVQYKPKEKEDLKALEEWL